MDLFQALPIQAPVDPTQQRQNTMTKNLGSLEQMLMLAVVRLGGGAHGLQLRRELERVGDRKVSPGAVYATMDRLEKHGLVRSWISDETPDNGGRRRKFYGLEPAGAEALLAAYRGMTQLAEGCLDRLADLSVG